jgi:hypothetical protein
MKILPTANPGLLAFVCVVGTTAMAFGCDQIPAGQPLWIRLAAPVSTYTVRVGDPVHAVLTQDLVCDDEIVLPMGTAVEGVVRSKRKVGWGIRHETAALELEFNRASVKSGASLLFTARVDEVENAREQVRKGVIQGIRSSETFQGSINSRLIHLPTWNPYSDPVLIAYKATFPIFPEPEIYYPAGTDIRLRITRDISSPQVIETTRHELDEAGRADADQIEQAILQLPWRVTTKKNVDADILNIVFLGSGGQLEAAFREAGWTNADPASRRAWMKNLYALLNNSGYEQQPMMTFLLNGKPQDMSWQKSLNSYGRRDHVRIWQWSSSGSAESMWVTSSTHDTGAALAVKHRGFVHHIAPNIDEERATVIRDLNFAGCVRSISYVSRPKMPRDTHNALGEAMHTDGSVAVVALQNCQPANPELDHKEQSGRYRPGNHVFRYIRRSILTVKNDLFRANIIYGAYDVGRMTIIALRKPPAYPATTSDTGTHKPPVASTSEPAANLTIPPPAPLAAGSLNIENGNGAIIGLVSASL